MDGSEVRRKTGHLFSKRRDIDELGFRCGLAVEHDDLANQFLGAVRRLDAPLQIVLGFHVLPGAQPGQFRQSDYAAASTLPADQPCPV